MYPHHGTHGLAHPFGWTNGIPTKPLHCHNTLPATPSQIPNGLVLGGPMSTKDTPITVVVKTLPLGDTPTRGLGTIISSTSTQDYACLPGQGKHDIIYPRWRHRPEAVSIDRIKASHKANVVALERNSIQRHHDPVNDIFKLSYIRD